MMEEDQLAQFVVRTFTKSLIMVAYNNYMDTEEIEKLSEEIHHLYCAQYLQDHGTPYWTEGDYSKLDERTKEYDRNIARFMSTHLTARYEQGRRDERTEEIERVHAAAISTKEEERI